MDQQWLQGVKNLMSTFSGRIELCRLLGSIGDRDLEAQVIALARSLSRGELPPHVTATRTPVLYERARHWVYASNAAITAERLYQWEESPYLQRLVATNSRMVSEGVHFSRTFVLSKGEVIPNSEIWDERSLKVLTRQMDAGIEVRVIWAENIKDDILPPERRLAQNFTIFDGVEAVRTTDVQVGYRAGSAGLRDLLIVRNEQFKYSRSLTEFLPKHQ